MKNALICFLKYPEPGHVKTRLAAELDEISAARLYESMAERVITEVYPLENDYDLFLFIDTAHPVEKYREWIGESFAYREQSGGDLGERLKRATAWAFESGYEKVAVIGSDCIGMDQSFVESVFESLDEHDFTIGPSTDGGYYLVSMKASSPWLFDGIEWSTNSVMDTTLDKIEMRDLKVKQLEEKIDVDTLEDLVTFKDSLPEEHFLFHKIDQIILDRATLSQDVENLFK